MTGDFTCTYSQTAWGLKLHYSYFYKSLITVELTILSWIGTNNDEWLIAAANIIRSLYCGVSISHIYGPNYNWQRSFSGMIQTFKEATVSKWQFRKRTQRSSTSKIEMPVTLVLKIIIYVDNEWACMLTDKGDKLILWQLDMQLWGCDWTLSVKCLKMMSLKIHTHNWRYHLSF